MLNLTNKIASFKQLVDAVDDKAVETEILLPICHTPKFEFLSDIINEGVLKPKKENKCFEDELILCFYYGKISYIPREKLELQTDFLYPISFIFDLIDLNKKLVRLIPFDSGGIDLYEMGKFQPRHFEINKPVFSDIKKLVWILFESSKGYLDFTPIFKDLSKQTIWLPALEELWHLYEKLKDARSKIGMQAGSFEIHFEEEIELKPIQVICKDSFLSSNEIQQQYESVFVKEKVIIYETVSSPLINVSNMNKALLNFLKEKHSELN